MTLLEVATDDMVLAHSIIRVLLGIRWVHMKTGVVDKISLRHGQLGISCVALRLSTEANFNVARALGRCRAKQG